MEITEIEHKLRRIKELNELEKKIIDERSPLLSGLYENRIEVLLSFYNKSQKTFPTKKFLFSVFEKTKMIGWISNNYFELLKILMANEYNGIARCHKCITKSAIEIRQKSQNIQIVTHGLILITNKGAYNKDFYNLHEDVFFLCLKHLEEYNKQQGEDNLKFLTFDESPIKTSFTDAIFKKLNGSFESGKRR